MSISGHNINNNSSHPQSVLSKNPSSKPAKRTNPLGKEFLGKWASFWAAQCYPGNDHGIKAPHQNVIIPLVTVGDVME